MLMNFYKMLHCHIPNDSAVCSDCHKNLESHKAGHIGFFGFHIGCCSDDSRLTFHTMQDH